jgi:glucose/arabinose dehydrogenase
MVRRACAAVALAAAMVAASCGSGDDDAAGRTAPEAAAGAAARATATPSPAPAPAARATATPSPAPAPAATPAQVRRGVRLARIGTFSQPVHVTSPPDDAGRLFVVEQAGRILVVRNGRKLPQPFLDIRSLVTTGSEQGLLSIAFPPGYARSGRFYVYYTDRAAEQRIVEYRRRGLNRADPGSARLVLRMADPESNHNGGLMLFGPDGLMYVGTGDGGGGGDQHGARGNAQNLGSLLGKLLRIDPRPSGGRPYRVPGDNPFVSRAGAQDEVYAYGLRNPWRFSFDRRTGNLVLGDVGQGAWEEIDYVGRRRLRGANFGWRPFEGRARYTSESAPGHVRPVIVRSHDDGNCSITGGVVVRDPGLPALDGRYVFGDFCRGRIESARLVGRRAVGVRETRLEVTSLSSFGEDARGRVYAVSLAGPVYRLAPR